MKKSIAVIGTGFLIFIIISRILSYQYDYPVGRDTQKAFGNREYQILKNVTPVVYESKQCLYNEKYKQAIIENIFNYKNTWRYVYFFGDVNVYVKLDKKTNTIFYYPAKACSLLYKIEMERDQALILYDSFESFSEKDRYYFNKLQTD